MVKYEAVQRMALDCRRMWCTGGREPDPPEFASRGLSINDGVTLLDRLSVFPYHGRTPGS